MAGLTSRYAPLMLHPLIDVTVTTLGAGKTHTTTATGQQLANSQGVSQTTQIGATLSYSATNSQTTQSGGRSALDTLQLSSAYGDGCKLFVVPPVDSAGNTVDCEIRPRVDGQPFDIYFNSSASVNDNLFPLPGKAVGAMTLDIGVPYRKALAARMSSLPLKATGWKYKSRLQFDVFSNLGWGVSAAPVTPLRILVYGDKMDDPALAALNAELQAAIKSGYDPFGYVDQVVGFPAFAGKHEFPGKQITAGNWGAGPNGPTQVGTTTQVFRFLRQAYNSEATTAQDPFFLSTLDAVGGSSDNVAADINDLGFNNESSSDYYRLDIFGNRPGTNQGWVGVKVGETVLPTTSGAVATANVNPWNSGEVQPQRPDSSLYMAPGKSPFPVAVNGNKVVFFVTGNGTAIPAQISGTTLQDASQVVVAGLAIKPAAA